MRRLRWLLFGFPLLLLLALPASADSVTDTITVCVGYYGWSEDQYVEKATYHWTDLDDMYGGALDTHTEIYSYYNGRTYLVAARGFYIRDLLYYAGIDTGSVASIDFFTRDHDNGAYRSFSAYSLLDMPRYYFPNLAANEETGEIYPFEGDPEDLDAIWNGATQVEAMLALEDYTEWDVSGTEFAQRYDPNMMSPSARFHLFFGQSDPTERATSSAAKYCYKLLITFSGTPVLTTEETNLDMKIGSGHKIEVAVDAEDGLLNDYVRDHIVWSSSDETVVSVAADGTLTVLAPGDAVITASFGESSVSVGVHAEADPEPSPSPSPAAIVSPTPSPSPTPLPTPSPSAGTGRGGQAAWGTATDGKPASEWPDALLYAGDETADRTDTAEPEESRTGARILPPEAVPVPEPVSGKRVLTISPQALRRSGNPDVQEQSGGHMDEDTEQLVLKVPERASPVLPTALAALLAFGLGALWEIIRFKRLLRGTRL